MDGPSKRLLQVLTYEPKRTVIKSSRVLKEHGHKAVMCTLAFRKNGDFSRFTGVKVDGTLIDAKNYTAVSGSAVATLKAEYLKTLSAGVHKLTVSIRTVIAVRILRLSKQIRSRQANRRRQNRYNNPDRFRQR